MPYVEVWVDELDCKGHCDEGHELKKRRDYAAGFLFDGDINSALDALTKGDLPENFTVTKEVREKYQTWAAGKLDGFAGPASLTDKEHK